MPPVLRLSLAALIGISSTALAAPGGDLGTARTGYYICEMPGDATGPAGLRVAREEFRIITGSSYATALGRGTYLLTGDDIVMTSGPKKGARYRRSTEGTLLRVENGTETGLRCVRRNRNNDLNP